MKKVLKFNDFLTENNKEDEELNKIQSWLKGTTEAMDDWDWDGDLLTIFLDGEAIEKYTRKDLEEENVL